AGKAAGGSGRRGFGEKTLLDRGLEAGPPVPGFAQPAAALQVAEHGLGQQADRAVVVGPLQLFLALPQVFEHVAEPQEVRFALAHGPPPFRRPRLSRTAFPKATAVPLAARR